MLASDLSAKYLSLGKYVTKRQLFTGFDKKRRTKVVDITKTRSWMQRYERLHDRPLIVDTHHPEGIVLNNVTTVVFVLRCDPAILIRRLRHKNWSREKIRENVMAEALDSCYIHARLYYGTRKLVQLDTSHSSVKHSVETAKSILSGAKIPTPRVNWLSKLENNESLSIYLGC